MAAGRHGGYRDNEFKDRESDFDVSRGEFVYSKDEYDRNKYSSRYVERGRVRQRERDARDRIRVRQKDIKERETVNGGYHTSSSTSNSGSSGGGGGGPRQCGYSDRAIDREPGELSSESGSDEGIESDLHVKDNEVSKVDNGMPSDRKRKFSPIVWDREDKEIYNSNKSSEVSTSINSLPPPPPLPKSYRESSNLVPNGSVEVSPMSNNKVNVSHPSPAEPVAVNDSVSPVLSESPVDLSSESPRANRWSNDIDVEQAEDDDIVPTRNISASRWAGETNSSGDEGGILDDEEMHKRRKKMPVSDSLETRLKNKSQSPELGEVKRDGSEGVKARTLDRPSSEDDYTDNDLNKNDSMEIDDKHDIDDIGGSQPDTDSEDENDSRGTPEPAAPPLRSVDMLQGCRSVDEFERLNKIDEGTYGVVYRARDRKTGEIVALKKVKMEKEREGFPMTSLREINILLSFHHPSIVDVKEVVVGSNLDSIFMVMEYMEHDLKGLMETMKQPFSQSEVKCLMLQLLEGVKYLHDNWVLHRDLKTSNLLLNNRGELKICDFGLSRQYGSPLKPYTHLVVTLWYRAPELLLGAKQYSTAIDMWSLGCIMAELLSKEPLFNGKTEFDQLDKIFRTLGTPSETIWPGFSKLPGVKVNFVKHQYNLLRKKFPATSFTGSPVLSDAGFDLLNKLLTYDPEKAGFSAICYSHLPLMLVQRITAEAALNHEWFHEIPLPKSKDFMPTFPAQHAQDRRMRRVMKSPDPLEEQRRRELQQAELGTGGLFG
ncbi:Protein kinase domain [Dillenia turbinata]|uniref:cyclin-dependent kinase n=1 Tax=Dillenia turbinata TaxID=194707 RepID=A0AAN8USI1_9MAGN